MSTIASQGSPVSSLSDIDLRRLVLKLRWVGLEEEAAQIEERLTRSRSDRLVLAPVDTD